MQVGKQVVIKYLQKKGMTPRETHEDMVQILAEDFIGNWY